MIWLLIGMSINALGFPWGTRPRDGLIDAMPQAYAGLRSEPPMSLPSPIGLMPEAMAAASPPDEPPAVNPWRHGLCVGP